MAALLDILRQHLDDNTIQQMSHELGADENSTRQAIEAALPSLIGGMSYNAHHQPEGAQRLNAALERDHDGSLLSQMSQSFGGQRGGAQAQAQPQANNFGGSLGGLGGMIGNAMGGGGGQQQASGGGLMDLIGGMLGGNQQTRRAADGGGILEHIFGNRRGAVERGVGQASGLNTNSTGQLLAMLAPMVMSALGQVKRQNGLNDQGVRQVLDQERQEIERQTAQTSQGGLLDIFGKGNDNDMASDIAKVGAALGGAFILSRMNQRR